MLLILPTVFCFYLSENRDKLPPQIIAIIDAPLYFLFLYTTKDYPEVLWEAQQDESDLQRLNVTTTTIPLVVLVEAKFSTKLKFYNRLESLSNAK